MASKGQKFNKYCDELKEEIIKNIMKETEVQDL